MMRSLYITIIYLVFLVLGTAAPFVFTLGYVWVDTFSPQSIVYIILNQLPVSLIMAVAALGGFIVLDRRKGRLTPFTILLLIFAVWVTLSTAFWAEVPSAAWEKWNYAVKTLCFAAFIPFVIRSRIQIEAFLQIYLFSLVAQFLPGGIKTVISGGGYGQDLGIIAGNSGLSEGSTLAAVSLMLIPIILYLRRYSRIFPANWITSALYIGLAIAAVTASIGTYERTALIGLVVVGGGIWLRSDKKVLFAFVGVLVAILVVYSTSSAWNDRVSSVSDYGSENSALGRILVWRWTLQYVATHPLGGGFNSYLIDRIEFPPDVNGQVSVIFGKAFHSIYFEVLGEQGWFGLILFGSIVTLSLLQLQTIARKTKKVPGMLWAREMAFALQVSIGTLLACGAFIGIGFQPMIYYLFAMSACLREHIRQVLPEAVGAHARSLPMQTPAGYNQ